MRQLRSTAAVAAAVLLMVGCATGEADDDGSQAGEINRDAVLRVGVHTPQDNLDPDRARTYSGASFYLDPIYDRLLQVSPDGEIIPMLATSWEFIDDGAALRLELRDDVTFSDGSPFNAEVAKANLERSMSDAAHLAVQTMLNSVESVTVVDEFTIDIAVKPGTGADLPAMLADPAGYMISGEALDNPDLDQNPVGSGPYELVEYVPNVSVTVERRDEEHWSGAESANFASITIEGVTDPRTLLDSMIAGQYDLVLIQQRNERTDQLGEEGYVVLHPVIGYFGLMFNQNLVPEFNDPRLRQAFSYAIDRQSLADVTLGGSCHPTQQLIAPGDMGHIPALDEEYPHDPERSRELFDELGIDSMDLSALYIADSPSAEVAEAVQAMLADVGVNVTLQATTGPTQTSDWLEGNVEIRMSSQTSMADKGRLLLRSTHDPILMDLQSEPVMAASEGLIDASLPPEERLSIIEATNTAMVEEAYNLIFCHRTAAAVGVPNLVGLDEVGSLTRAGFDYRPLGLLNE